jgi:hypothetical protein
MLNKYRPPNRIKLCSHIRTAYIQAMFSSFQIKTMSFSLDIIQTTLVKKTKPGVVRVYDYYDPGKDVSSYLFHCCFPSNNWSKLCKQKPIPMSSAVFAVNFSKMSI